ncbi:bifunctional 2',3'-cyclic-nucleotide 2'-phosphodiesterase/3'-nucleotidase [Yoonia sp.]|uniref:bifunctional 2',3'-cyclic-nucleotide 2'-phosphodiesterase/3'-nucleotidase n=1 Tax=Yoonia sp. TaxID=2212373 RepID=UPI003F6A901C
MISLPPERDSDRQPGSPPRARLRILETTDLHMQLLPYDYFTDRIERHRGLIHLADQIDALRNETGLTTLLFDNGDFLQGNPLADFLASQPDTPDVHPMIAAFNTLRYDAVTLGNHEFNYGLPFLRSVLRDALFPVTCANIRQIQGPELARPFIVLDRDVPCDDGTCRKLRIGVVGFVTPQITQWDKAALDGQLGADDIVETARDYVPRIKAAGADIIVALCHSGIAAIDHAQGMENAAVPLAAVDGIDVILTGHTHEIFPGGSQAANAVVDPRLGRLHGKPAVMAGFYGNCLGVIDLDLRFGPDGVDIAGHASRLHQEGASVPADSVLQGKLRSHVQAAHDATLAEIRRPIARTKVRLHSYFSSVSPDLPQQLLACAQMRATQRALHGSAHGHLPVLSASAPFRSGGRAGPGHFVDIAPGPVMLRDAAAIYPFANVLCAVRRTGAQLCDWLEWAASHFNQITPGQHDQPLINPQIPAYDCDTLFGLSYRFDLTHPARFGPQGAVANPRASRLRDLRHAGRPVQKDDIFVVATNAYRANGGGGFAGIPADDVVHITAQTTHEILIADLRDRAVITDTPAVPWTFSPIPNTSATFRSAPAARDHLPARVSHSGPGTDGFDLYRLTF